MKKLKDDFTKNEILELSKEFKKRRNYLGISQLKLSRIANLSQSIINKFENGKIDPTYSSILKIEKALTVEENISNLKACDIMISNIISIKSSTKIFKALEMMRENDFSQLLVIENNFEIGTIYEKTILDIIAKKVDIYNTTVKNFIEIPPIIISPKYPISDLSYIFQNKNVKFILVKEENKICGLITKSDLFRN